MMLPNGDDPPDVMCERCRACGCQEARPRAARATAVGTAGHLARQNSVHACRCLTTTVASVVDRLPGLRALSQRWAWEYG